MYQPPCNSFQSNQISFITESRIAGSTANRIAAITILKYALLYLKGAERLPKWVVDHAKSVDFIGK